MVRTRSGGALAGAALAVDGTESSRTDTDTFNAWLRTLAPRNVVVHAVVMKSGNGSPEAIAATLTLATGGLFETVSPGGLAPALKALGARVAEGR